MALGAGVIGYLKLSWDVETLKKSQERWQSSSEVRRNKNHDEMDVIRSRIDIVENNVVWLINRQYEHIPKD